MTEAKPKGPIRHYTDHALILWDCPSGTQVWARTEKEAASWSQTNGGGSNVKRATSTTTEEAL